MPKAEKDAVGTAARRAARREENQPYSTDTVWLYAGSLTAMQAARGLSDVLTVLGEGGCVASI
eukprot:3938098-Rhodomonas_salina.3